MLSDRLRNRHEDHALLLQLFLEGGGNRNGIEHGIDRDTTRAEVAAGRLVIEAARLALLAHAGEDLLLFERNAKLLVGAQNLGIDISERLRRFKRLWRRVVVDVLIIDLRVADARPGRLAHGQPSTVRLEPPGKHPLGLVLFAGDETDGVFRKALRRLLGFDFGLEPILVLINVDTADLVDGLLYGRHLSLRSRLQGPRVGVVGYGARAISVRWFPWLMIVSSVLAASGGDAASLLK